MFLRPPSAVLECEFSCLLKTRQKWRRGGEGRAPVKALPPFMPDAAGSKGVLGKQCDNAAIGFHLCHKSWRQNLDCTFDEDHIIGAS